MVLVRWGSTRVEAERLALETDRKKTRPVASGAVTDWGWLLWWLLRPPVVTRPVRS